MNTTTDRQALHSIRDAQLKALAMTAVSSLTLMECQQIAHYVSLCGTHYDTRNLSDKALEEIDTLAQKYLERIA